MFFPYPAIVAAFESLMIRPTAPRFASLFLGVTISVFVPSAIAQFPALDQNTVQLTPKQLVETVWQIVDQSYLDSRFNGQNWKTLQQQYLTRSYSSSEAAYSAIRELLTRLGDPYTHFVSPEEYQVLQPDPEQAGIGLQFVETTNRQIVVIAPNQGSSSAIAGILPQDILKTIEGRPVQTLGVYRVAGLLQGKPGTSVKLVVQRGNRDLAIEVVRQKTSIAPIRSEIQTVAGTKVGFIQVLQLSSRAVSEMQAAIESLEQQGVKGYILDLRSNPSGSFEAAIAIAQMWLRGGNIVSIVRRQGQPETETASQAALSDKPLVVLVDRGTANVSEILAASLQDRQRAKLVGTRTFGNSHIQSLLPLADGSAVSVTVAKWVTPSGKDVHGTGLQPDIRLELTPEQQSAILQESRKAGTESDRQYIKAVAILMQQITSNRK